MPILKIVKLTELTDLRKLQRFASHLAAARESRSRYSTFVLTYIMASRLSTYLFWEFFKKQFFMYVSPVSPSLYTPAR